MISWKSLQPRNPLTRAVVYFGLIYTLLILSWKGFTEAYVDTFQAVSSSIYGAADQTREITFEHYKRDPRHPYYTRVVIVNQRLMNPDGSGPIRNLDFETRGLGWIPVAIIASLFVATPLPWKRKGWPMFWALIVIQTLIFAALGFFIWDESSEIGLVAFTPFWKQIIAAIRETLTAQLTMTLPIVIWLLFTFRIGDLAGLLSTEKKKTRVVSIR